MINKDLTTAEWYAALHESPIFKAAAVQQGHKASTGAFKSTLKWPMLQASEKIHPCPTCNCK